MNKYLTEAQISLLISFFSLTVAGIALGWQILRDLVRRKTRARSRLFISIEKTLGEEIKKNASKYIDIGVTNTGFRKIYLQEIRVKTADMKKGRIGLILLDPNRALANRLPCTLEEGENAAFFIPLKDENLLNDVNDVKKLGVSDSLGKVHWVPKRDIRRFRNDLYEISKKEAGGTPAGRTRQG